MAPLKVGDKFPEGVKFEWAPITDPDPTACGIPQEYDASKEFAGKKVVIVSVPGAFTPSCQAFHIPPYLQNSEKLTSKGVDLIIVIATNDSWVMSAWAKVNGVGKDSKVLFMSDSKTSFGKTHGWSLSPERNGRWAMIVEKDGKVSYSENESNPKEVTVSGADAILGKL